MDSFSDDDEEFLQVLIKRRRRKIFRARPTFISEYDEVDFQRRFRLDKGAVTIICERIQHEISPPTERNQAIPAMKRLLIALRFYATGGFYMTLGDLGGVSSSTVCQIVKKTSRALYRLRKEKITMPSREQLLQVQQKFFELARFPRVIGAIDCTHIKLESPGGNTAEIFRCRKGFFSLNVQAMVDADTKICDLVTDWPGSTHDQTIFNNSAIKERLESREFGRCLVVGDSGYTNTLYLVTPLLHPTTAAEQLFNESQIRTRNVVERSYGIWKRRFPCLHLGLRQELNSVRMIIWATAVLHNIAVENGVDLPPDEFVYDEEADRILSEIPPIDDSNAGHDATRQSLIANYFQRL